MNSSSCVAGATVFLIEDDSRLAALVCRYLDDHGMCVLHLDDPAQAERLVREREPPLVLLDIGLGSADGIDLCRRLRPHYHGVLCIFSARADDMNQVVGLELGADDFITKPIEPRVLLARLRAHLRRGQVDRPDSPLAFGRLRIDLQERQVELDGAPVTLTTAEFDLLVLLASNAGRIMDRDALLRSLRRIGFDGLDRSIDTRISRLRRKLGDTGSEPGRIKTVRGQGYLFSAADWS